MQRRSFLASILAAGVAPAAVGSSILMPVRKLVVPPDTLVGGVFEFPVRVGPYSEEERRLLLRGVAVSRQQFELEYVDKDGRRDWMPMGEHLDGRWGARLPEGSRIISLRSSTVHSSSGLTLSVGRS